MSFLVYWCFLTGGLKLLSGPTSHIDSSTNSEPSLIKKNTHCLFKLEDLFILACDCNLSQMNSFNVIKSVTIVKKDNCCLAMYSPISFIHLPLCKNHLDTRSVSQSCIMLFATYVAGFGKTLLLRGAPHLGEHFMINDINITTICHPSLKAMVLKSQVA